MSKTIKRSFNEKLIFENMYNAHIRASKTKRNKKEVILFEIDLENNLINLIDNITNNTYKLGKYREFTIYEPKQRVIKALPYKDRIVQQWYIYSFIKPYIIPRFINNTYACIDKRGTHKAIKDLQRMMRQMIIKNKDYYVLKCDVKKYFYNIDKKILFDIMKKYISDKKVLSLTHKFIYDNELEKGIPIGNYTS